ncbi:polygalacturonase [Fusarium oxysporum f. sp. pisi HDV247]|uniref:endo-polygalacturonase n=1 Tax=Fusarium oxysporum f. sp. pisi HDV247 TaxID=1080344 RepID=W9NJT5_FUSOX|nr:polygalacturonase [Fusarium oxysporum f. sp. pisi HDV247]
MARHMIYLTALLPATWASTQPLQQRDTCTVTDYSSLANAVASCKDIVLNGFQVPTAKSLDLTKLKDGATVTFAGNTTFDTTANNSFNPIRIGGKGVTITGASGHVIDGNGPAYWDGKGSNNAKNPKPDHFIVVSKTKNSKITNLNIQNWPVHCFDITGNTQLNISGLTLNNTLGDKPNANSGGLPAAHNTDGFDIASSDHVTLDNNLVYNQDDCVAVTSGTNITVSNMHCSGGHGLSIGSVGGKSNNVVDGVQFLDSQVVNSQNGCRIKSNSGTTGTINNVTFQNIALSNISKYGVDVQQDYTNSRPTGNATNGVKISDIKFINITGSVSSAAQDWYILCGNGSCSGFTFSGNDFTGGKAGSCNYPSNTCPSPA